MLPDSSVPASEPTTLRASTAAARLAQSGDLLGTYGLPALSVGFSILAYWPILQNYFVFDDFLHLYNLVNNGLLQFLLTPHGGHLYMVRNLIFAGCYWVCGFAPQGYFALVLLSHAVNVYLLFRVIRRASENSILACFGATLWGVSSTNRGALGWYSVYGHVLVTTIVLWLLNDLLRVAARMRPPSCWRLGLWYVLLLAGVNCFGVGIALAMISPFLVYLLLPQSLGSRTTTATFSSLMIVVPILYAGMYRLYAAVSGDIPMAASDLVSLSQWRLVVDVLGEMLLYSASSLVSSSPCTAGNALLSCWGFPALCVAAFALVWGRAPSRTRRCLVALILIIVATYGMIAIGRAQFVGMLQSPHGVLGMTAIQRRYHYLGPAVIAIVVGILLSELSRWVVGASRRRALVLTTCLCGILLGRLTATWDIDHHEWARVETQSVLSAVDSLALLTANQDLCIRNQRFRAIGYFVDARKFPGWAAVFAISQPGNSVHGRTVHFVETDPAILAMARANPDKRIGGLLVGQDSLPSGCQPLWRSAVARARGL